MDERLFLGLGVFVGFIVMVLFGWLPIVGAFSAGLGAGAIASARVRTRKGGAGIGAAAGFLAGIIGGGIIAAVLTSNAAFLRDLGAFLDGYYTQPLDMLLVVLSLGGAIAALIGGLIGGVIGK